MIADFANARRVSSVYGEILISMRFLLLLIFLLIWSAPTEACSCFGPRTFCATLSGALDSPTEGGTNLVEVKTFNFRVVDNEQFRNQPMIDIRIEKVFFGSMLPGQRFTLPLQDGGNCRDWVGNYEGADSYILILDNRDSPPWGIEGEVDGAYPFRSVTFCAVQSVKVNGNRISGQISEGVSEMGYDQFLLKLNECLDGNLGPEIQLDLYPNPSSGLLRVLQTDLAMDGVRVFDVTGRLVYSAPELEAGNSSGIIDLRDQPAGVYLVRIIVGEDQVTRRVVLRK